MTKEELSSGGQSTVIFLLSLLFIYFLLSAQYESYILPFAVILSIPTGIFGVFAAIGLKGIENNIYVQVALVMLIGLLAKNAILIVEFAKERVDRGMELIPATLEAVQLRLRPIIMTSLAFILGVLPLAFASGAAAESRKTIGWTVFGGMLAATSLAIFVVPVLFVLIEKIAGGKKKEKAV
jgi:HAE1 family hydrophobic/amphiphilic exporter-1